MYVNRTQGLPAVHRDKGRILRKWEVNSQIGFWLPEGIQSYVIMASRSHTHLAGCFGKCAQLKSAKLLNLLHKFFQLSMNGMFLYPHLRLCKCAFLPILPAIFLIVFIHTVEKSSF